MELRSKNKPAKTSPSNTFICGQCQEEFDLLAAFLRHRASHADLHSDICCHLCSATLTTEASTLDHYTNYHQVDFAEEDPNQEEPYCIIEVAEDGNILAVVADTDSERVAKGDDGVGQDLSLIKVPEKATDDYLRNRINYKMAVEVSTVKGARFSYGKTTFRCLFCSLHVNDVMVLSRHMFNRHKSFVNDLNVEQYEKAFLERIRRDVGQKYSGQLLTLAKYRRCHQRQEQPYRPQRKPRHKRNIKPTSYPCETCGKVFKQSRLKRIHMETHRIEKNFLCDECGKAFKSQTRLTVHRKCHKEKIFKCKQCEFESKLHSAIHAHRQVHPEGCVLCHICGAAYTDRSTLTKHMAVHSLDRPYPCSFAGCTWRFKSETMSKAHFRSHTSTGRYRCGVCNYLFRHKHHLQRHLGAVHGIELVKNQPLQTTLQILPTNDHEDPSVPLDSAATDMQMIQVVLNEQVHQEVVNTDIAGLQVYKLFTS